MMQTPEELMLAVFRRCGKHAARGAVTAVEFTNRVFDEFASFDRVYPEIIPTLWGLVPEIIRGEFAAKVRHAAAPGFRYHAFYIGGNLPPPSEEELRRDADLRTARVQAWAVEFVRILDRVGA